MIKTCIMNITIFFIQELEYISKIIYWINLFSKLLLLLVVLDIKYYFRIMTPCGNLIIVMVIKIDVVFLTSIRNIMVSNVVDMKSIYDIFYVFIPVTRQLFCFWFFILHYKFGNIIKISHDKKKQNLKRGQKSCSNHSCTQTYLIAHFIKGQPFLFYGKSTFYNSDIVCSLRLKRLIVLHFGIFGSFFLFLSKTNCFNPFHI